MEMGRRYSGFFLGIIVSLIANLLSPGLGIPGVLALAATLAIFVLVPFVWPRIKQFRSESTRQGRRERIFKLIDELDFVTYLFEDRDEYVRFLGYCLWGLVRVLLRLLTLTLLGGALLYIYSDLLLIGPASTIVTAVVGSILGASLGIVSTTISSQYTAMRGVWLFRDYTAEMEEKIRKLSSIDGEMYLYIHSVSFGVPGAMKSITRQIKRKVDNNELTWVVGEDVADPAPGEKKSVTIKYSFGYDYQFKNIWQEGETIHLRHIPY